MLILVLLGYIVSEAAPQSELYSLPAKALVPPGDSLIDRALLTSVSPGQTITASPGQTISLTVGYQIWQGSNPNEIDQMFLLYSWSPSWPPPSGYYAEIYNDIPPSYPGTTGTKQISITVPKTPGTYYIWVGWCAHYSVPQAVQGFTKQPSLPAHIRIIIQESESVYQVKLGTNSPPFGESIIVDGTKYDFPDFGDKIIMLSAGTHSIQAIAPPGYGFLRWYDTDNTRVYNIYNSSTILTVKGNGVVGAEFGPIVTFYTSPTNGGSISVEYYGDPQNPIKTYSNGQSDVISNIASRLRANPSPGYVFVKWTTTGNVTVDSPHSNPTGWRPSGPGAVTAIFQQATYTVSFQILDDAGSAVSGASLVFAGSSYTHGSSTSVASGSYSLSTGMIPSGYRFKQWETRGGVSVASQTPSTTTATVSGDGSITMRLQRTATVIFSVSGMSSDASETVLTVDGTSYFISQLPASFTWDVGSAHSFDWKDYVLDTIYVKRYRWVSTSGLTTSKSGAIIVPFEGGLVQATYKTQYRWKFSQSGIGSDATGTVITVDGTGYDHSSLPLKFWWDEGSSHSYSYQEYISTLISGKRYACHNPPSWSGTVIYSCDIDFVYHTEYQLNIAISPTDAGTTSPKLGSYWYDLGSSVSVSATANAGYTFSKWQLDGSDYSTSNPVTVTMSAPHTLTVVFSETTYTISFQILDDTGNSVSGATLVFDGTTYSHGGSTSKPAGFYSLSTGTIPSGYKFKTWEVSGSIT
ncbi:MAG: hypothetical protein QXR13_02785, partial [Candidatus Bathyarchaeia archaeon]